MAIDAIIFDIGGVLETTPPTGWQERWPVRLGLEQEDFDARLDPVFLAGSTGAMSLPEVERAIAAELNLDRDALREFMDDLWTEYVGTLNVELARYFAGLRPRYRTGILSNSFVGAREREQELYGFEEMCDAIVYSHEEGVMKPDPQAYRIACARLGAEPCRCVLLDDTEACIDGARAIGMQAIRFTGNLQAIRDLDELLASGSASQTAATR